MGSISLLGLLGHPLVKAPNWACEQLFHPLCSPPKIMISLLRLKASPLFLTLPIILNFIFIPLYLQNSSRRYQIYGLHSNLWLQSGSTPTQKNAVKPTSYPITTPQKKAVWILILFRKKGKTLIGIFNLLYGLLSVHHLPWTCLNVFLDSAHHHQHRPVPALLTLVSSIIFSWVFNST